MNIYKYNANQDFNENLNSSGSLNEPMLFRQRQYGYDMEQVDQYIKELSAAYNVMYDKYMQFKLDNELLRNKTNAVGNILLKTEVLAGEMLDDANKEAVGVIEDARDVVDLIFDALAESKATIDLVFKKAIQKRINSQNHAVKENSTEKTE